MSKRGAEGDGGPGEGKRHRKGVDQKWQAQEAARKLQENRRAPKERDHRVRHPAQLHAYLRPHTCPRFCIDRPSGATLVREVPCLDPAFVLGVGRWLLPCCCCFCCCCCRRLQVKTKDIYEFLRGEPCIRPGPGAA